MTSLRAVSVFSFLVSVCAATSAPASTASTQSSTTEQPIRVSRRLAISLSPDLLLVHPGEFLGGGILPALRLTGNLSSRIALTASVGGAPEYLKQVDLGLNVALFTTPFTPYAGVSAGAIFYPRDDIPGHTDPFAIALVGVSYVTLWGLDLAVEGGGGYVHETDYRPPWMLRCGVRVGYRFGSW